MTYAWKYLAAVCALVIGVYAYMSQPQIWEPWESWSADAANAPYNLLVQGFRAGQLSLKKDVPPALLQLADPYEGTAQRTLLEATYKLHDLTYYKGRLFLYFGVAPALILLWPFAVLTGHYLLHREAVLIFYMTGFLTSVRLLYSLWRRYFADVSVGVVVACVLALGLAGGAPALLSWAGIYEVPISCGYMLTMLALAAIWKALQEPARAEQWLAAASAAYGLAVASRPDFLFGGVILFLPVVQSWRERRKILAPLLAATGPIMFIGLGLMLYNFLRFENPLEFGMSYAFTGINLVSRRLFGLQYFWFNFRVYFLEPAHWGGRFPFIHDIIVPPVPSGHWEVGHPFGVLSNMPLVWLALAAPLAWRNRLGQADSGLRWFVSAVALLFGVSALTVCLFFSSAFRYEVDFLPTLMLLAVVGILGLERVLATPGAWLADRPAWRCGARLCWGLLLGFSVAFNLLVTLQYYSYTQNELGRALLEAGKPAEAAAHFEQALWLKPDYSEAQFNLGTILVGAGKLEEAIGHFEQAVRLKPDYAEAHSNLGSALLKQGKARDAIAHYEEALRINPDSVEAHYNLGHALARLGRMQEAVGHWEQALRLKPDNVEAHWCLGTALEQEGRMREAKDHYEQALRIKPDYPEALNSLGWLLATREPAEGGDPIRAMALAQHACQLTNYQEAWYLDTLAAAYAAATRFGDAIATAEKALELARAGGQTRMAGQIESRLQLYRGGRAYREATDVKKLSPLN